MEKIIKPRVFLSHSSKDKNFINRLNEDLKKCKIDTWLDTEEIRDGQPWMKVIFEHGIPTCDTIIAYFTENALHSQMMEKEVDASLIRTLDEEDIKFLPYVDKNELRKKLRIDIKGLQSRKWNEKNYHEVLPSVVAEIWLSFSEKFMEKVVTKYEMKVEELVKENEKLRSKAKKSTFSDKENSEYEYIFKNLNQGIIILINFYSNDENPNLLIDRKKVYKKTLYEFSFLGLLLSFYKSKKSIDAFGFEPVKEYVNKHFQLVFENNDTIELFYVNIDDIKFDELIDLLLTYSFITPLGRTSTYSDNELYKINNKINRFRYWCEYNNKIGENPLYMKVDEFKTPTQ